MMNTLLRIHNVQVNCLLQDPELDPDDLFKLTRDLKLAIGEETDIEADVPMSAATAGSRGDPITLGALALTFLSSGAAVALIKVLQTYVARRPSLEVELSRETEPRSRSRAVT